MDKILLSLPHMNGTEQQWINRAFTDNWVVPLGPNVDEFERRLSEYIGGRKPVVALSAGTAAMHLGLVMLGVKKGDEVICQSFTFAASANPVVYCGAQPVFVDSEPTTWNIDSELLEKAIKDRMAKTGKKPAAIIPVYLYGMPPQMERIMAIAEKYDIPVLEDSTEAMGSKYKGVDAGTIASYGAMSFNGNKIITTSGGGALICPDKESADRVKFFATQARENRPYYYHNHIGYNYRLSNICAGIGCAQMDTVAAHVQRRKDIHKMYKDGLADIDGITVFDNPSDDYDSNFWLTTILLDPGKVTLTPDQLRLALWERGIESRLLWRPMHMQPIYADAPAYVNGVSESLFNRGLCLPSGSVLTDEQIQTVIQAIHEILQ